MLPSFQNYLRVLKFLMVLELQVQQWCLQATSSHFCNSPCARLSVKLDSKNFSTWKSQVIPAVIGHGLDKLLFSENACPTQRLVKGAINPEYQNWIRNDQSLLNWLKIVYE